LRTRNVTSEFVTIPLYFVRFQFFDTSFASTSSWMSAASESCTTSVGSPCTIARAWSVDAP